MGIGDGGVFVIDGEIEHWSATEHGLGLGLSHELGLADFQESIGCFGDSEASNICGLIPLACRCSLILLRAR
jgi:hypothetical protein